MVTAQQVIKGYKKLPPQEKQTVIDYFVAEAAYFIEEDNEVDLSEDLAEAEQIKAEENSAGILPTPFDVIWARTQKRLQQERNSWDA